jgi:hypothetical protein
MGDAQLLEQARRAHVTVGSRIESQSTGRLVTR